MAREFAPGIPAGRVIKSVPRVSPKSSNQEWDVSLSMHPAAVRGDHYDLRLVDPSGRAHSWAMAKLPEPGKSTYAAQQATHSKGYALRKRPWKIPPGYGATRPGKMVEPVYVQKAEVVQAGNEKIRFLRHHGQETDEFVLRKVREEGGKPLWALNNATKNRGTQEGKKLPSSKPKYKEIRPEQVAFSDVGEVMTPKLDGAHVLVDMKGPGAPMRVYSYRPTERKTGIIEHTFKFPNFQNRTSAPSTKNTMIRAELWGSKDGKAIPAEELGGLLNSGVLRSRKVQQEKGIKLRLTGIDVVKHQGRDYSNKTFDDKLRALRQITKGSRGVVEMPRVAVTEDEKRRLMSDIEGGRLLETREGVVIHRTDGVAPPTKVKFKPQDDVYVREIFDKPKGKARGHAGGFAYSITPDGPVVGKVGTGFSHTVRKDMLENPDKYVGRVAKVRSQGPYKSGALRAPSFDEWHIDKTPPELMKEGAARWRQVLRAGGLGADDVTRLRKSKLLDYGREVRGLEEGNRRLVKRLGLKVHQPKPRHDKLHSEFDMDALMMGEYKPIPEWQKKTVETPRFDETQNKIIVPRPKHTLDLRASEGAADKLRAHNRAAEAMLNRHEIDEARATASLKRRLGNRYSKDQKLFVGHASPSVIAREKANLAMMHPKVQQGFPQWIGRGAENRQMGELLGRPVVPGRKSDVRKLDKLWAGKVKEGAGELYHGSPYKLDKLEPKNIHGDPRVPAAVFGTPSRPFALAYSGDKWGDRDLEQSMKYDDEDNPTEMSLREMRPGALKDVYGGRKGYLYTLPGEGFEMPPRKGARWEQINRSAVTPMNTEEIADVMAALKDDPIVRLHAYDPKHPRTLNAVKRSISRMGEMAPEDAAQYKKWRLENAPPEIAKMFEEEMLRKESQADTLKAIKEYKEEALEELTPDRAVQIGYLANPGSRGVGLANVGLKYVKQHLDEKYPGMVDKQIAKARDAARHEAQQTAGFVKGFWD